MSNYDGKLGEWLKYVQQQVDAADTKEERVEAEKSTTLEASVEEIMDIPENVVVRDRMGRSRMSDSIDIDMDSIIADSSLIESPRQSMKNDDFAPIFDDTDLPNVEDYLPFLKDAEDKPAAKAAMPTEEPKLIDEPKPEFRMPTRETSAPLSAEGTGEPKPVVRKPEEPKISNEVKTPEPLKVVEQPKPVVKRVSKSRSVAQSATQSQDVQAMWDKLPKHIQVLMGQNPGEIAQNSYKQFKETRDQLIARLLDPTLSLEEAARILNVCPTTVRRYTNKGSLAHYRTDGNQRRFRLSDVLAFLETMSSPAAANKTAS